MSARPALVLAGYTLHDALGRGALGAVYAAVHQQSGAAAAVKVLRPGRADQRRLTRAIRQEVRLVAGLRHPGVVPILDHGVVDEEAEARSSGRLVAGPLFFVMPRAAGSWAEGVGRTDWDTARTVAGDVLGALAYAHARGVIHRDIKPANLLQMQGRTVVADFGIAQAWSRHQVRSGEREGASGTPGYAPAEQAEGRWRDQGPWTDIHSLARTVLALVYGTPDAAYADAPPLWKTWLAQALAHDPRDRFARAMLARRALGLPDHTEQPDTGARGIRLFSLRDPPCIGRDRERRVVAEAWDAAHGTAQVVILRGPAGVGKTRLCVWFAQHVHQHTAQPVLDAAHNPIHSAAVGLGPMVGRFHRCMGLDHEGTRARLGRELSPGTSARDVDVLAEMILPGGAHVQLAAEERYLVLRRWLHAVAPTGPALLWMDDVQWGADGLGLCRFLIENPPANGCLILATAREETLADRPVERALVEVLAEHEAVTNLAIGELDPADHAALLDDLLPLDPASSAMLRQRTQGNPLFTIQLLRDWVQLGRLQAGPRGFSLIDPDNQQLPASLDDVWSDRIDRSLEHLEHHAEAMEVAAALGQAVNTAEWLEVLRALGLSNPEALIERLLDERLVVPGPEGFAQSWRFTHGMLREAYERRASRGERSSRHHRACADVIARSGGVRLSLRLAHHHLRAGDDEAAIPQLEDSFREWVRSGDLGMLDEVARQLEAAFDRLDLPSDDPRRGLALARQAETWALTTRIPRAAAVVDQLVTFEHEHPSPAARLVICRARAYVMMLTGRVADAIAAFEARQTDVSPAHGRVTTDFLLAWALAHQRSGSYEDAYRIASRANREDPAVMRTMGAAASRLGRRDEAEALLTKALELFEAQGALLKQAVVLCDLAILYEGPDLTRSFALQDRAISLYDQCSPRSAFFPQLNQANIRLQQRDYTDARPRLERCLAQAEDQGRRDFIAFLHVALMVCDGAGGDWDAWTARWARAMPVLDSSPFNNPGMATLFDHAAALAAEAGRQQDAREMWRRAADRWTRLGRTEEASASRRRLE